MSCPQASVTPLPVSAYGELGYPRCEEVTSYSAGLSNRRVACLSPASRRYAPAVTYAPCCCLPAEAQLSQRGINKRRQFGSIADTWLRYIRDCSCLRKHVQQMATHALHAFIISRRHSIMENRQIECMRRLIHPYRNAMVSETITREPAQKHRHVTRSIHSTHAQALRAG